MCGLVGVVHWDGEPVQADALSAMVQRLRHRGPDALGTALPSPGLGLGHARLKVIDLSEAASQPMVNEAGTCWLVYNGEVYNFPQLRRELEAKGVAFRSRSDTEVILRAYEAWGPACVQRLDGMFALAVWDARSRQLLLARDRAGKKPLFYWTDGRCLAFASEIKALLAHAHVPCEMDETVLPSLLAFGYPPTGQTCYRGIRQVPPGSLMQFSADTPRPFPQRYWEPSFAMAERPDSTGQASLKIRQLLTEAIRRRLAADVPLGAFLSGGVDSTVVVGLMAELMPQRPIQTFSIGFEGDARFDETRYAKLVAERFRTEHTAFTVGPQSFDLLERLVWHHDQPFGDSSAVPTYILSQLAREHVTVALTGDGGDELFAGYVRFLAALWSERIPSSLMESAHRALARLPAARAMSFLAQAQRFLAVARHPLPERYLRWIAYDRTSESLSALHPSLMELWKRSEGWGTLSRLLHLNFHEYLANDLLVKADRCSMAHGLEVRSPLLDTALIEYVAALPADYKARGRRTKIILKQACRDLLPVAIRRRGKMGFGVPLGTWFRGRWREPLQDYLGSPGSRAARYVDQQRTQELIADHLAGRRDAGHQLWLLLTFEVWLRQLEQPRPLAAQPAASERPLGAFVP